MMKSPITLNKAKPFYSPMIHFFKNLWRAIYRRYDNDGSLRETIEELIEESNEDEPSIESDERQILGNVLNLRDLTAYDVMTPRADILAVPITIEAKELVAQFVKTRVTRLPVYRENLDNVVGIIHVKDVLNWLQSKKPLKINTLLRDVFFISPAMLTLDLLLQMRETGSKMAIVVDEYGGVDGLVTFASLIEEIIGDIQDAHNQTPSTQIQIRLDGTIITDGRTTFEELEEKLERKLPLNGHAEDIDTIGGFVTFLAGRVPIRGELITHHPSGVEFEVLDADLRRVKRLCIRNLPEAVIGEEQEE